MKLQMQPNSPDQTIHCTKKEDKWNCYGRLCCRSRRRDQLLYPTISRSKHHHFFFLFIFFFFLSLLFFFFNVLCWGVLFPAEAAAPPPEPGLPELLGGFTFTEISYFSPALCNPLPFITRVFFPLPSAGIKVCLLSPA